MESHNQPINQSIFGEEIDAALQSNGYSVLVNLNHIEIVSKNASSWVFSFISVLLGLVLGVVSGGDPKIVSLSLLLVFYPIVSYRRHSRSRMTLFTDGAIKQFEYQYFLPNETAYMVDKLEIEVHTYSRSSYTSPFESGNREYFLDLYMTSSQDKRLELFHFASRNEEELTFGKELAQKFRSKLEQLTDNPD